MEPAGYPVRQSPSVDTFFEEPAMRHPSRIRRSIVCLFFAAIAGCVACPDARAEQAAPADALAMKIKHVVIFKDGYGLVMKDATATADAQGRVYTNQVPDSAVLGTVWAISDQDKILSMSAQWDKHHEVRKEAMPCLTQRELLRANVNHKITIELDDKRTVTGTVVEMLEAPGTAHGHLLTLPPAPGTADMTFHLESDTVPEPFADAPQSSAWQPQPVPSLEGTRFVREIPRRGGDFVVLATETDHLVLPVFKIVSISGKELQTTITHEEDVFSRAKRLTFDFGKESAGKPVALHFFYFTPGFKWVPTYRITGNLKDQASLALQGEILNDQEDIADAGVDLVVGVPNFRFKEVVSPLTLERVLRNATGNVRGFDNGGNMLNAQVQMSNSYQGRTEFPAPTLPAEIAAGSGGEQDLFIYPLENFSLAKDGRASAALWQSDVPVRNVYTYEIKARRNRASGGQLYIDPQNPNSPNRFVINQIWHQLELKNNSKVPWTTGAAITMRGTLPLGQDILGYTSVGSKTLLPLTIAVDMHGTTDEEEISRKPNAAQFEGYEYALVQKKGTVTITNGRKENSEVCVSVGTGGKVETASDQGKIKLNDFHAEDWDDASYTHVNNHSDISWEFTLKPGETKTVEYTVSFYVH
jgi:hypothetical protein